MTSTNIIILIIVGPYSIFMIIRPLFFYFLVYGFLGSKNRSVCRKKIKNNFFSKGPIMSSCRKSYRYMEIVIKSDILRNY